MTKSEQLPFSAYATAFLQIDLFFDYLFRKKTKAGPVRWRYDIELVTFNWSKGSRYCLHTCPIHSTWVGLSSLAGGLSPIATGNGCMALDQWYRKWRLTGARLETLANRLDRIRWRQLFLARVNRTLGSQIALDRKYLLAVTRNKHTLHVKYTSFLKPWGDTSALHK